MPDKILFIGAMNRFNFPQGGEEYKNQILIKYLEKNVPLTIFDTHQWKQKPAMVLKMLFTLFFGRYKRALISASSLSTYRLLSLTKRFPYIQKRIVYAVIGGYFPEGLRKGKYHRSAYSGLKKIIVEGHQMKKNLVGFGLNQTVVVPNFKEFPIELLDRINMAKISEITRFVFLSRIQKEKGVLLISKACEILRTQGFQHRFNVTYFGFIPEDFDTEFRRALGSNEQYGGFLDLLDNPESAYKTLADFHVMLFPTFWQGEGFPGVIIDAFIAGLPVIASDWNMNTELIQHKNNGLIVAPQNAEVLAEAMKEVILHPEKIQTMAQESKKSASKYHIQPVGRELSEILFS